MRGPLAKLLLLWAIALVAALVVVAATLMVMMPLVMVHAVIHVATSAHTTPSRPTVSMRVLLHTHMMVIRVVHTTWATTIFFLHDLAINVANLSTVIVDLIT